jgi:polysaccharide export outer membrane protein
VGKGSLHFAAIVALTLVLAAPAAAQEAGAGAYRIGPNDLLDIRVFEVPELNVERRVTQAGTVSLPLIGEVEVAGMTPPSAAARLKELLESRYVQRASVDIQVREFRSRPITVIGAVRQPGPLPFPGRMTLLEAVAAAGGLADKPGDTIHVLRRSDNGLSDQIGIPVADLLVRGDPKANIPIFANDLINVPAQVDVTVYCVGEVGAPGALVFTGAERVTLLAALARAGGLTERASKKLLIKRLAQPGGGAGEELTVDYGRIVAGRDPDPALAAGDVIVVKESFF